MIQPKISIIVPIYNVENYIKRCINSLLNQSLKDIEIILIDDESPDNCPEICDEYSKIDCRIKVIHKKNQGLGFARNSGIEIANGEYIAFVDSDDFVDTNMYATLYEEAKLKNLDTVFCNFFYLKSNAIKINNVVNNEYFYGKKEMYNFILDMIGSNPASKNDRKYSMSVWHAIYSKSIIDKNYITFPSERNIISEDLMFHINYIYNSNKIGFIKNNLYFYCENKNSLSKSYRPDRFNKYIFLHNEIIKKLKTFYPNKTIEVNLRSNRLLLGYVRNLLLNQNIKIKDIQLILNNTTLRDVINKYPYKTLPIKYKLYFILMKYNLYKYIIIINWIKKIKINTI